jgi:anti-sigma regulatory factor (Ser/Thr protein kinase)
LHSGVAAIDARTDLVAGPTAPSHARRFVREVLAQWGLAGVSETVILLANELVTNAVLHAGTDITLDVSLSDATVRVEVVDASPRELSPARYGATAQTGRGLTLVQKVASDWGVTPRGSGKAVWFEVTV